MVEHLLDMERVEGSNPSICTGIESRMINVKRMLTILTTPPVV